MHYGVQVKVMGDFNEETRNDTSHWEVQGAALEIISPLSNIVQ